MGNTQSESVGDGKSFCLVRFGYSWIWILIGGFFNSYIWSNYRLIVEVKKQIMDCIFYVL